VKAGQTLPASTGSSRDCTILSSPILRQAQRLTNMGYLIPSCDNNLMQIFTEKVPGTDRHLKNQPGAHCLPQVVDLRRSLLGSFHIGSCRYLRQIGLVSSESRKLEDVEVVTVQGAGRSAVVVIDREILIVDNFVDLLDVATGAGGAGAPAARLQPLWPLLASAVVASRRRRRARSQQRARGWRRRRGGAPA
jgi:hypothetical protein